MDKIFRVRMGMGGRYGLERDGGLYWLEGDVFGQYQPGADISEQTLQYLAPVRPSKILGIGLNYKDHAAEMRKALPSEPLMFAKPSTAVIGPDDTIRLPAHHGQVDHEAELAVVIGKPCYKASRRDALTYVLGYTCLNDVTDRDLQKKDVQYTRAKGFDTFAPMGPCIAVGLDPTHLTVEGWVNGEKRQDSNTDQLIFPVDALIEFASSVMTLLPGDVISTGTPSGVGPLKHGDRVMVKIAGIGTLSNPVIDETPAGT